MVLKPDKKYGFETMVFHRKTDPISPQEASALCAPPKTPKIRPKIPKIASRVVPKIGFLRTKKKPYGALIMNFP